MQYKILGVSKNGKDKAIKQTYRYSVRYGLPPKNPRAKAEETFKVKYGLINRVALRSCDAHREGKGKSILVAKINPGYLLGKLWNFLLRDFTAGHHNMCQLLFILA